MPMLPILPSPTPTAPAAAATLLLALPARIAGVAVVVGVVVAAAAEPAPNHAAPVAPVALLAVKGPRCHGVREGDGFLEGGRVGAEAAAGPVERVENAANVGGERAGEPDFAFAEKAIPHEAEEGDSGMVEAGLHVDMAGCDAMEGPKTDRCGVEHALELVNLLAGVALVVEAAWEVAVEAGGARELAEEVGPLAGDVVGERVEEFGDVGLTGGRVSLPVCKRVGDGTT